MILDGYIADIIKNSAVNTERELPKHMTTISDAFVAHAIGKMKTKLEKELPDARKVIERVAAEMLNEMGSPRFFIHQDGSITPLDANYKSHELKILPKWFDDVKCGKKNFEIRKADRDFKVGDYLILREWERGKFTERFLIRQIEYIYQGDGSYGISEEYCILGIKKPEESQNETIA